MEGSAQHAFLNLVGNLCFDIDLTPIRFDTYHITILDTVFFRILRVNEDDVFRHQLHIGCATCLRAAVVMLQIPVSGQNIGMLFSIW